MPNNTASKRVKQHSTSAKENGKVKSYPPPKQLATPTDLKPEEVERIVAAVNPLLADAFALFTKTKNFHLRMIMKSTGRQLGDQSTSQPRQLIENTSDPLQESGAGRSGAG
jgi:hypothetical protein